MKRILLLSDIDSEHTEKWALGLAAGGVQVGLFSFRSASKQWYKGAANITLLHSVGMSGYKSSFFSKLSYLRALPALKHAIKEFRPDVVHAHYATSYGLLGRMSGFHPFFISAWGTDVMKFPDTNFLFKRVLRKNLAAADLVLATSNAVIDFIHKVIPGLPVKVVPFGVDTQKFSPQGLSKLQGENALVISCIKSLEKIYCIDVLIEAFALLKKRHPDKNLRLMIVGQGSEKENLEALVRQRGLVNDVLFTGRISFSEVADYHNRAAIAVNISEYESFGVSVIEAMACGKPVVVTSVGGLKEIVKEGEEGLMVPVRDVEKTAAAIEKLVFDEKLREEMGKKGREKVMRLYNWNDNLEEMLNIYKKY